VSAAADPDHSRAGPVQHDLIGSMRCHARCLHRQQVRTAPRVGARHPAAINNNGQSKAHAFAFTSLSVLPSFGTMVSLFSTCGQTSNQHSAVLHCCLHACNHSVFQTHTPIAFLKLCWLWMNSEREPLSPACATGTTPACNESEDRATTHSLFLQQDKFFKAPSRNWPLCTL
jgi:hypothetical protein